MGHPRPSRARCLVALAVLARFSHAAGKSREEIMRKTIGTALLLAASVLIAGSPAEAAADETGGKVLRFIPQADLRVLDPVWTTAYITRNHAYMIYDTLFATDEHFQVQPQMVERWEVSPDKLTWRFWLRDGLKFHDGKPVRAQDCVATLARWMQRDGVGQKLAEALGEMKPLDERSFSLTLKYPFPRLLPALGALSGNPFIMPE